MDALVDASQQVLVTLQELKDHHCRWPIGTVGEANFGFCGRKKRAGSYCAVHAKRAFRPPQRKHRL
jgi:GcrA cell cycle regulator